MEVTKQERLPFSTFDLPIEELRRGYYSAVYFWREKRILEQENNTRRGLMQVFNKVDNAVVCGIDEALAVIRAGTGYWKDYDAMYPLFDKLVELKAEQRTAMAHQDWDQVQALTLEMCLVQQALDELWQDCHEDLEIHALQDGDRSPAHDAVMTIEGQGSHFAHLESIYLGILARGTKVASNTKAVVDAARGKPVLFFADRFDRWHNQVADGYAAMKSGAFGVATDCMGKWWGADGSGTQPHALIALYMGDTSAATLAFAKHYPDTKLISLVDFDNDCVNTSLKVARACEEAGVELWGIRLDTSGTMVDKSVQGMMGQFRPTGVCIPLTENVREAHDKDGRPNLQIGVSGGFNAKKIDDFEEAGAPTNFYGTGSSILEGNFDFTADIVMVDGVLMSKVGRIYRPGAGLNPFAWAEIEPC